MRVRDLTVIAASLLTGCATPVGGSLVVNRAMQAELPDGTPVYAMVVVPSENVLNKNQAWQEWDVQWPRKYQVLHKKPK